MSLGFNGNLKSYELSLSNEEYHLKTSTKNIYQLKKNDLYKKIYDRNKCIQNSFPKKKSENQKNEENSNSNTNTKNYVPNLRTLKNLAINNGKSTASQIFEQEGKFEDGKLSFFFDEIKNKNKTQTRKNDFFIKLPKLQKSFYEMMHFTVDSARESEEMRKVRKIIVFPKTTRV